MFEELIKKIFYLDRSLLGPANNEALEYIARHVPLRLLSFPSGQSVYDWEIPQEWVLKTGILREKGGPIICNASHNILNIVNYSQSYRGEMSYQDLLPHLHFSDINPECIPYRTSYYSRNWGFCLPKKQFISLDSGATYDVEIEANFVNSEMKLGELKIPGRHKKEIIFTAYLCHPLQFHDGLSGVACLLEIYNKLKKEDNFYTYRFFFLPETIGPIALLANKIINPQNVDFCFISTCVSYGDRIKYKKSFIGNHPIDNIISSMANVECVDFFPNGSDERQFSSPKIRIPTSSIMRAIYGEYPQYHTSGDDLSLINYDNIIEIANMHIKVLERYEERTCYIICHDGCEPFLSKKNLYREIGATRDSYFDQLRNWIIFLSDGTHSILDISKKLEVSLDKVEKCVIILEEKGVIRKKL